MTYYFIQPSIDTYEDLLNFKFLFEKPTLNLESNINKRVIKLFFSDKEFKTKILSEISKLFANITHFTATNINREISHFIYRKFETDKKVSNVNFYFLLKLLISGDSKIKMLGEVCEIVGQKNCVSRIKLGGILVKGENVENREIGMDINEKAEKLEIL